MADIKVCQTCNGQVVTLTLENPPVNALSLSMRRELYAALQWVEQDERIRAVVLTGRGRGFCAGGDIREFGTADASATPGLSSHIHAAIERMSKPVIAAVHGFAIGGGLETVLACHYRVAEQDAFLALPEVSLGTLPLSATQRLPRLLGVLPALQFMVEGHRRKASEFFGTGVFDRIAASRQGLAEAQALAADLATVPCLPAELKQRLVRNRPVQGADLEQQLFDARQWLLLHRSDRVSQALMQALEASVRSVDFDAGLDHARRLFDEMMAGEDILRGRDRFLSAPPGHSPPALD